MLGDFALALKDGVAAIDIPPEPLYNTAPK